jgi:hypothetical protein
LSVPESDARHLATLGVSDLFETTEFSEPLIICLANLRKAVLDGRRRLLVGEHTMAWSGGSLPQGHYRTLAAIRSLVPEILRRDPVLARHIRRVGKPGAEDEYEIGCDPQPAVH